MEQLLFKNENLGRDGSGKATVMIDGSENFHLSRVLRVRAGEKILATNGAGKTLLCVVSSLGKDSTACEVLEEFDDLNSPPRRFCIAMAVLKPMSKLENAVEKCTELGAGQFLLFNSERSEKVKPRPDRLRSIVRAAVKQSLRSRIPELVFVENLEEVVDNSRTFGERIVLHEKADTMVAGRILGARAGTSFVALIGPEGGFTESEIAFLLENGYGSFSLGKGRLRSETAAISVATLLSAC